MISAAFRRLAILTAVLAAAFALLPGSALSACTGGGHFPEVTIASR
jgi:hypothetical protein